ncbi:ABC transporter ATP-binding protein [Bradyrhizobium retamae]|uniref:Spermidine/putrescine ABC transporter ATP-binding protein n=1 Tax=Bradyrhizobium retamae TaxID=1300035 RepID=A0A0R3MIV9_9BRAD|nr:ABC transporter ATP-binding protein [Bradyrhizobium retamae]KRR17749.1 spermidine/putrescine ABC transporter ATP-binding protein [Bradyrhizobium retamae]
MHNATDLGGQVAHAIALKGISKTYGPVTALHPTDLSVEKGEFLTLLGPSGSGKTTLLNLIAGATGPTTGTILLDGCDITRMPPRERGIGMVFQNYALMPHMNVFDNVAYPLRARHQPANTIRAKVTEALDRVGLRGFENRKPRQLSGGQQQRVGIARCIVYSPTIILMDEPLGALDKNLREQMQGEIKRLHKDLKTTVIYVTHDQEEAFNMSDRICLMSTGQIAQLGTPDELYFEPVNEFVADFVGESNLIEGKVTAANTVMTSDGLTLVVCSTEGHAIGSLVKVLVRPEKIEMIGRSAPTVTSVRDNACAGTVAQTSFVGGMTRIAVRCDGGRILRIKTVSSRASDCAPAGLPVTVSWAASDTVVLKS